MVGSGNVDGNVVFFNRVTKAGSSTLMQLFRFLSTKNGFTLMRDVGFNTKLREDIMIGYEQQVSQFYHHKLIKYNLKKRVHYVD